MRGEHHKIQQLLFSQPHLIHQAYLMPIVHGLGEKLGIDVSSLEEIEAKVEAHSSAGLEQEVQLPNSIAVIGVHGVLVHRGGWLEGCGIRSYEAIRQDVEAALTNPNVSAILLDIDSGGGQCAGLFDFCDFLRQAGSQKPLYAFAHDFAYSAAYAIACCASKIFVAQSGEVGSIGAVAVHYDCSGANAKAGIVVTPIHAGAKKVDGGSHAPLSDSAKADWQYSIDAIYNRFVSLVATNRKIGEAQVRATEAGCFIAEDALKNGLADTIASFDQVISEIFADIEANTGSGHSALTNPAAKEGNQMPIKLFGRKSKAEEKPAEDEDDKKPTPTETETPPADPEKDGEEDENPEPETSDETEGDDEDEGTPEEKAKAQGYAEALGVVQLAALAGKSISFANRMLEKGMTTEEVRASLMKQRSTSASSDINGHHKAVSESGASRMAAKMKQRFSK